MPALPQPLPPSVHSAEYSNVPVYESIVNDIPVMRRRSDSYVNAIQILKVAGFFNKDHRKKIMKEEVYPCPREVIKGGYWKYQGTW